MHVTISMHTSECPAAAIVRTFVLMLRGLLAPSLPCDGVVGAGATDDVYDANTPLPPEDDLGVSFISISISLANALLQ